MRKFSQEDSPKSQDTCTTNNLHLKNHRIKSLTQIHEPGVFRSVLRKLHYITQTWPDIEFGLNYLCRFQDKPTDQERLRLLDLIRYLTKNPHIGVHYPINKTNKPPPMAISAKLDKSHADCPYTAKTTYSYCIYLDDHPLIWKSRRTTQVMTRTASTAYIAINYTAQEAIFMSMILEFMGHKQPRPMKIQSNNEPVVKACKTSNITPVVQTLSTIYHFIHD